MKIKFNLNGENIETEIRPDTFLIDVLRNHDCLGVKKKAVIRVHVAHAPYILMESQHLPVSCLPQKLTDIVF